MYPIAPSFAMVGSVGSIRRTSRCPSKTASCFRLYVFPLVPPTNMAKAKTVGVRLIGVTTCVAFAASLQVAVTGAFGAGPAYRVAQRPGSLHFARMHDRFVNKDREAEEHKVAALERNTTPSENISSQMDSNKTTAPSPEPGTSKRAQLKTTSAASATRPLVSQLQKDVDYYCAKRFEQQCAKGVLGKTYCTDGLVVGRYVSQGSELEAGWHCFKGAEIAHSQRQVKCVDNCGNLMKCFGDVNSSQTAKVAMPGMDEWIDKRKWTYCSPYQQAADALCNLKHHGDVARYDHVRQRWMCLDLNDVALDGISYCADNCGGPTSCVGGLLPGELPQRSVRIVRHRDMESAFEAIQPCPNAGDICVASTVNPPACLPQVQTLVLQRLPAQQRALDTMCQDAMDEECRKGKQTEDCFGLWLARYELESSPGGAGAWRCYPESRLDFTKLSSCIDGCGNPISCRGQPAEVSPAFIDLPALDKVAGDMSYCSAYQRAGNAYCAQKHGPRWVARQNCNTYKWACFNLDNLPPNGWVGCAGHCGEFIWCPSAGTGDAVSDSVQDEDLESVILAVPDPCLAGEKCEPTAQEPAYCSVSRPNPHAKVKKLSVFEDRRLRGY
ncbi:putative microneme protein [Toxoplasma gondii FOU]|uniref:Putative microneme protein n=1 Tax=Toxoplasma gondii FOU TaxID=943167 RepID=A0A086KYN7_TOXGO|nr:putative microneme protein [Toxoplasma gondii FOU]